MKQLYNTIGVGYANLRKPDPRIAQAINSALGDAKSVVNVGAGTGSYEPTDRVVTALEPSIEMIRQRPADAAEVHEGTAEQMPFADNQFEAAMAVLTVHHWSNFEAGLREMQRVATRRLVVLTFDPAAPYFWLADYLPNIIALDQPIMPKLGEFERILGEVTVTTIPVPHDCTDGFLGAYWRRPQAYLNPLVRAAISTFAKLNNIADPLAKLQDDLNSGAWDKKYGHLLAQDTLDIGYRLVVKEF